MLWVCVVGFLGISGAFVADIWFTVDYQFAADVSLIWAALFTTAFVFLYGLRSNWRSNHIGRIFLGKGVLLSIMLWQIVLASWWDAEYPYRQPIRFAIYSLGALAYLAMVVSLWREQQRDRAVNPRW